MNKEALLIEIKARLQERQRSYEDGERDGGPNAAYWTGRLDEVRYVLSLLDESDELKGQNDE